MPCRRAVRRRTLSPLWQVAVEPVFADFYTPRLGMVLNGVEREARRIGYRDMGVAGEVRMVRQRVGRGLLHGADAEAGHPAFIAVGLPQTGPAR
jgi:hypothetical protein